ncbi:FadR/GntR family transcriptional regulator [Wenxinia marina]|uniref:Transcriptional regulator, GntR family n=1 Tax=Wenxinia marina DSM 24838 TaxID=1123501 RepID=A0A0D0Q1S7_9RHOB|nr:FCD domain-containing protein [Wenxinia marina]KIQ68519.1 transcriptional regulator, GntR family [Wenxinia marina DSM 24838]GGL66517.1 transcriptional regulator [Wenxinia marina]
MNDATPSRPPRRSRPVKVAEAIKDWVVSKGLKTGDRLPGEADLMARFGMAKSTIREAMRILEAQGLIETRTGPGGGSFVGRVSTGRARALLANYFYFRGLTIGDIYQMRRALEPVMAEDLAGRLTPAQLDELRALADACAEPATDLDEERAQHVASLRFHARLAEHAGNELLGFVVGFMAEVLSDITVSRELFAPPNPELRRTGHAYQIELIAALARGDGPAARRVMAAHMETAQRLMEGQEARVLSRFIEG